MNSIQLQQIVALEIADLYCSVVGQPFFVAVGHFELYDIISRDKSIRIEIKCESTPIRTGKVCIEYWNIKKNCPSGILATAANLWLHIVLEEDGFHAYEYDIAALQKLTIEEGAIMDNGYNSKFKLIPLEIFKKHAKRTFVFESILARLILTAAGITDHPLLAGQPME